MLCASCSLCHHPSSMPLKQPTWKTHSRTRKPPHPPPHPPQTNEYIDCGHDRPHATIYTQTRTPRTHRHTSHNTHATRFRQGKGMHITTQALHACDNRHIHKNKLTRYWSGPRVMFMHGMYVLMWMNECILYVVRVWSAWFYGCDGCCLAALGAVAEHIGFTCTATDSP